MRSALREHQRAASIAAGPSGDLTPDPSPSQERVAFAGQQGQAERTCSGEGELLAGRQPARRELGLRHLALDLGRKGMELELHEEVAELLDVWRGAPQGVEIEGNRQVRPNGRQPPRKDRVVTMLAQALADFALDPSASREPIEAAVSEIHFSRDLSPRGTPGCARCRPERQSPRPASDPPRTPPRPFVGNSRGPWETRDAGARDELGSPVGRAMTTSIRTLRPSGDQDDVVGSYHANREDGIR